jgi:uncharacterized membrane protein YfcA
MWPSRVDRLTHGLIVFGAACAAGAVNSVAGGGSLLSFPTLVWLGLPSVTANATNTVALWPGALGAVWGYRRELRNTRRRMYALTVPSVIGGIIGALLLRLTPGAVFDRLVPVLILFATVLFMIQEPVQRMFNRSPGHRGGRWLAGAMFFQLIVGVYGGYFGAGIGILMLAVLAILGHDDIHQMNGFKNLLAASVNGVASAYFVWMRMVSWPDAGVMAAGAIVGGVAAAGIARRLQAATVRRMVIAIGFAMAAALLVRR